MAAPTNMRVKLDLAKLHQLSSTVPRKCWILINLDEIETVAQFENVIRARFSVDPSCELELHLDQCLLPPWENINVVHGEDLIAVRAVTRTVPCGEGSAPCTQSSLSHGDPKLHLGELQQCPVAQSTPISPDSVTHKQPHAKKTRKRKEHLLDDEAPNLDGKRLYMYGPMYGDGDVDQIDICEDNDSENEKPNSLTPTKPKDTAQVMNVESPVHTRKNSAIGKEEDVAEEKEMSALQLAIKRTLESIDSTVAIGGESSLLVEEDNKSSGRKRKRRRNRKKPSSNDNLPNESFIHQKQELSGKCTDVTVDRVTSFGAKHTTFDESEDNELDRKAADTPILKNNETIQFSLKDISQEDVNSKQQNAVNNKYGQKLFQPKTVHNFNGDSNQHNEEVGEEAYEKNMNRPTSKVHNDPTERKTSQNKRQDAGCMKLFNKGPFANVKVYNRNDRKKNKKSGFVPLTKEEQLNTLQTNTSYVIYNEGEGETNDITSSPGSTTSASHTVSNMNDTNWCTPPMTESMPEKIIVKDYIMYDKLQEPPQKGDVIAYKIMEMDENYCPGLSSYKEAVVLSFDGKTTNVHIELVSGGSARKIGRFDLVYSDNGEDVLDDGEDDDNVIIVPWAAMVEPRLLPTKEVIT